MLPYIHCENAGNGPALIRTIVGPELRPGPVHTLQTLVDY